MKNDIPNIIRKIDFKYGDETLSLIQENVVFSFNADACLYVTIENRKKECVAECSYNIYNRKECFLTFIEVNLPNYIKKGIGTALLKFVECDARRRGCTHMSGHFEPFDQYADYAKDFYKRNNYEIRQKPEDKFKRLYKNLKSQEVVRDR